jgi:CRP/FNR family cyclic AMP-dependent transcriptional regulator
MDPANCKDCNPQAEDVKNAFNFLTAEEIQELCPYLELKEWPADAVVMQEGEHEDYMGFVTEGRLAVKKKTGYWGKHIIIAILDKGTMVGEGAFIDEGPRSTTIVAMEHTRLLTLAASKMDELIINRPMLAIKLMKRILHIISVRLRKAGDRISELL